MAPIYHDIMLILHHQHHHLWHHHITTFPSLQASKVLSPGTRVLAIWEAWGREQGAVCFTVKRIRSVFFTVNSIRLVCFNVKRIRSVLITFMRIRSVWFTVRRSVQSPSLLEDQFSLLHREEDPVSLIHCQENHVSQLGQSASLSR